MGVKARGCCGGGSGCCPIPGIDNASTFERDSQFTNYPPFNTHTTGAGGTAGVSGSKLHLDAVQALGANVAAVRDAAPYFVDPASVSWTFCAFGVEPTLPVNPQPPPNP
jgi:hypothetical protein